MPDPRDETAKSRSSEEKKQSEHAHRFWRLPAVELVLRLGRDEPLPAPEGKQREAHEGTPVLQELIGIDPKATHLPQEGPERPELCDNETALMSKRIPQKMGGCAHHQ